MSTSLTLPDLVVLSLLTERAMHGYELNQELERREVRDWAGISRPQVYYSLKKLAGSGFLARVKGQAGPGPERSVFRLTPAGERALTAALAREDWATQRPPPPFLTWMCLSGYARPQDRLGLVRRRRTFLEEQLARERVTLQQVLADSGPMVQVAAQVLRLVIRQWEVEVEWLAEVEAGLAGTAADPGGS